MVQWPTALAVVLLVLPTAAALVTTAPLGEPAALEPRPAPPESLPRQGDGAATARTSAPITAPAPHLEAPADPLRPPGPQVQPSPAGEPIMDEGIIDFRCPPTTMPQQPGQGDPNDRTVTVGCPFRVYDGLNPFGNAQIDINHLAHNEVAFFALHGQPVDDGPHGYSRDGQTHVAFTSRDQGITWQDQPILPQQYPSGFLGELASGAFDPDGNIYTAYVWSQRTPYNDTWGGLIGLYKGPTVHEFRGMIDAYQTPYFVYARAAENPITRAELVYVPGPRPPLLVNATAGNLTAPAEEEEFGQVADGSINRTDERVMLVWHERAYDWRNSTTGLSAWIDAAWTHTGAGQNWTHLADHTLNTTQGHRVGPGNQLIGPCAESSNPVVYDGKVYVACVVDKGYKARPRAHVGDIDIWSIDPRTGKTSHVEFTGMVGRNPMLASAPDGYMVLLTHNHVGPQGAEVYFANGWFGRAWNPFPSDIGPALHARIGTSDPVRDARVTALAVGEREKVALLVYKEWQTADGPVPVPDLADPTQPQARLKDYKKVLVSFNPCSGPIAGRELELGTGLDVYNLQAYAENPAIYDDVRDGLVLSRESNGQEIFYMAVNDYGAMQFAGVIATNGSDVCPPAPPPPPIPPAPVPQALTLANPANLYIGATLAAAATAMAAYILTVKRKAPTTTTAEDK